MQNILKPMTREGRNRPPSNIVGLNTYEAQRETRVPADSVQLDWYTVRIVNPESETIDRYAMDVLMRVVKIAKLGSGLMKIYATNVRNDATLSVDESDAVTMDADGYFNEEGREAGYLINPFEKTPNQSGSLVAGASLED